MLEAKEERVGERGELERGSEGMRMEYGVKVKCGTEGVREE